MMAEGFTPTARKMIAMLKAMDDPSAIGPGMAVALITTLYGAMIANIVCGPSSSGTCRRNRYTEM